MGIFKRDVEKLKGKEDIASLIKELDSVSKNERELIKTWKKGDRNKYSEEELEAIRQILNARGHAFRSRKYKKGKERVVDAGSAKRNTRDSGILREEIRIFVELLGDYDRRERARERLIQIGTPATELLVQALYTQSRDIYHEALEVLAAIGKPVVKPLIATLSNENADVRSSIAWAIYKLAARIDFAEAVQPLIDALHDNDAEVRGFAAVALGEIGDNRAVEPLMLFLRRENSDDGIRRGIEALAKIGDSRAAEVIAPILLGHADLSVRFAAALALSKVRDKQAVDALIGALNYDKIPEIRWRAALSLGEIGEHSAIEPLRSALHDSDQQVRDYAAEALGQLGDTQVSLSALKMKLMESSDNYQRSTAAEKIAATGTQGLPILLKALAGGNSRVCFAAARAINHVLMRENKEITPGLYEALKPANKYLVAKISMAEVRKGSAPSLDEDVSAEIAALGFIGNSSAIPRLEELLARIRQKIKTEGTTRRYVQSEIAAGYVSNEDDILHIESAIASIKERESYIR